MNLPPKIDTVDELVAKSVFEKEFGSLKDELKNQQSITWQVVLGVGIAFVFAIGVIVADAIISRNTYSSETSAFRKETNDQTLKLNDLENKIDNLRIRNPYLK